MEIIFHIGMGKTGTSSIQKALSDNRENLRAQGVEYLGMWFDMIDPKFKGIKQAGDFFRSTNEEKRYHAEKFLKILKNKTLQTGISKFIFSNENLFGHPKRLESFFARLGSDADLKLIAYVRDPRDWLPSAYNQWVVYHKVHRGPIKSYSEEAQRLIKTYSSLTEWIDLFGERFLLRKFDKSTDVIGDLFNQINILPGSSNERELQRVENAESLLRALYNTRDIEPVLPEKFNTAFQGLNFSKSPCISDIINEIFNYNETDRIVSENVHIFEKIRKRTGINLLEGSGPVQKVADAEKIRDRLFEHLLAIVMQQADRITELEISFRQFSNSESR